MRYGWTIAIGLLASASARAQVVEETNGIPAPVVAVVHENYPDPVDNPRNPNPHAIDNQNRTRNGIYGKLRPTIAEFDQRWAEVQARKTEVDAAVKKAAELVAAKDRKGAREALLAVITPVPAEPNGRIKPKKRDVLEVRDAELPAVDAYVQLLIDDKDWQTAIEAGVMYWTRRHLKDDEEVERWYFLAAKHDKLIGQFGTAPNTIGSDLRHKIYKLWDESGKLRGAGPFDPEGVRLLRNYNVRLAHSGLTSTNVTIEKGKKGDWIQITWVNPTRRTDTSIEYTGTDAWRVPKACHQTGQVEGWDGIGAPIYKEQCEYDEFSRKVSLNAKVRGTLPDWARARSPVTVVGKIVASGPAWKLVDAFVSDQRFADE
jgi:hypothetical protein